MQMRAQAYLNFSQFEEKANHTFAIAPLNSLQVRLFSGDHHYGSHVPDIAFMFYETLSSIITQK